MKLWRFQLSGSFWEVFAHLRRGHCGLRRAEESRVVRDDGTRARQNVRYVEHLAEIGSGIDYRYVDNSIIVLAAI